MCVKITLSINPYEMLCETTKLITNVYNIKV